MSTKKSFALPLSKMLQNKSGSFPMYRPSLGLEGYLTLIEWRGREAWNINHTAPPQLFGFIKEDGGVSETAFGYVRVLKTTQRTVWVEFQEPDAF